MLRMTVISGQKLPVSANTVNLYVEVSLHLPDWSHLSSLGASLQRGDSSAPSPVIATSASLASLQSSSVERTSSVRNNWFNPQWDETLLLPFEVVGDMKELVFVKIAVKNETSGTADSTCGVWCASLGAISEGYRHIPLNDAQLCQYMFSTLFVKIDIEDMGFSGNQFI